MNALFLIRMPVAMDRLARWAGERGWIRHRGNATGFDEGRALHHLVNEVFGPGEIHTFRLLVAPRRRIGSLYGYCESDGEVLREKGHIQAPPEHLSVLKIDRLEAKAMPTEWAEGRRIGFDLRVRPVRRLKTELGTDKGRFRKGAELDAFLIEALRRHSSDRNGMAGDARARETVYLDWLAERLAPAAELNRKDTCLVHFQRSRISRGTAGPEGPDAAFHGTLKVNDSHLFSSLLARGVGRHRAYGYGMLLLRPACSRPAKRRTATVQI